MAGWYITLDGHPHQRLHGVSVAFATLDAWRCLRPNQVVGLAYFAGGVA